MKYVYHRGSRNSRETIEFDIVRGDQYITTCVVDVDLLICGFNIFPCGNGNDVKLTPEQELHVLEMVQYERKKITDSYPIKTYDGWEESGLPKFEDYCFPSDEVDEAMVEHFITSVPPVLMWSSCMQAGEPYSIALDESSGRLRDTYTTFHKTMGHWIFDGYCFFAKNENMNTGVPQIQRRIDRLRRSAK